jgi:sec-independent protein translocase protein TatA
MGLDNPLHIAFVLILLLLVFGAKRLPEIGQSLGSGLRGFKRSLSGEDEPAAPGAVPTSQPALAASPQPAVVAQAQPALAALPQPDRAAPPQPAVAAQPQPTPVAQPQPALAEPGDSGAGPAAA